MKVIVEDIGSFRRMVAALVAVAGIFGWAGYNERAEHGYDASEVIKINMIIDREAPQAKGEAAPCDETDWLCLVDWAAKQHPKKKRGKA